HFVDRENIVAIDQPGRYAKTSPASSKGGSGTLSLSWDADSPAVVLHNQYHGSLEDAREIQGLVKIALGGCPVTTNAHGYHRVTGDLSSHSQAYSVQHLRSYDDLNGQAMALSRPVGRSKTAK